MLKEVNHFDDYELNDRKERRDNLFDLCISILI